MNKWRAIHDMSDILHYTNTFISRNTNQTQNKAYPHITLIKAYQTTQIQVKKQLKSVRSYLLRLQNSSISLSDVVIVVAGVANVETDGEVEGVTFW